MVAGVRQQSEKFGGLLKRGFPALLERTRDGTHLYDGSAGYCVFQSKSYRSISVPVCGGGVLNAALTTRSSADDPWPPEDDELYLPMLFETAQSREHAEMLRDLQDKV